jgi:hypothetical protein
MGRKTVRALVFAADHGKIEPSQPGRAREKRFAKNDPHGLPFV